MATPISERATAPSFHLPRGNLRLFFGGAGGRSALAAMLAATRAAHSPRGGVLMAQLHRTRPDPLNDGEGDMVRWDVETVVPAAATAGGARLDAVLIMQRRPTLLLVDTRLGSARVAERELGRIMARCWRDIDDFLAAGIDVWAPLDASGFSSWAHCQVGRPSRGRRRGSTRNGC